MSGRGEVLSATVIRIRTSAKKNNLSERFSGKKAEYIIYCKRAILFLSSSKILTPHPPLRSTFAAGEDRLAGKKGGWGVNILEDERNRIALLQ
jgi:hypothetical protein